MKKRKPSSERGGPITAGDFAERLKSDPDWVAREKAREEWRRARKSRLQQLERPLIADLSNLGITVKSVWDLVNTTQPYPEAIPVLLCHLRRTDYPPEVREGIARALSRRDPQVKEAIPELLEAFRKDPDPGLNGPKWAIGNAIETVFDDRYVEQIVELACDRSHGPARTMLVRALAKSKTELAQEALQMLKKDPEPDVALAANQARGRRAQT
jgi:hypothetical protein